jgi:hypothetical protein
MVASYMSVAALAFQDYPSEGKSQDECQNEVEESAPAQTAKEMPPIAPFLPLPPKDDQGGDTGLV